MKELNKKQLDLLETFINSFLPKRGNKRKNLGNELDYVTTTLNKIFIQNFGFNLNRCQILEIFKKMGYEIFEVNSTWDAEEKVYKPSKNGNSWKIVGFSQIKESPYTYIDISSTIIRELMRTTMNLPEHTNSERVKNTEMLKQKIADFKSAHYLI